MFITELTWFLILFFNWGNLVLFTCFGFTGIVGNPRKYNYTIWFDLKCL